MQQGTRISNLLHRQIARTRRPGAKAAHVAPLPVVEPMESRTLLSGYANTTLVSLASFDSTTGQSPLAGVTFDSNGDLFGTTSQGGSRKEGTVFEIPAKGTVATTVASFAGANNGNDPEAGVSFDSNGDLFGATYFGGMSGAGTVFEIPAGSSTITTVDSFKSTTNGARPQAGLTLDANGDLFGTTTTGGNNGINDGTVFEIARSNASYGPITTLAAFDGDNGAEPAAAVILDANGNLFGTTEAGGDNNGDGTVFEVANGSKTITTLALFDSADGANPIGALTSDSAGDLLGTASNGGLSNDGVVFEIPFFNNNYGSLSAIASFNGADGESPQAGITLDTSGNIVGTTTGGGDNDGNIFEINKGSTTINNLVSFNGANGKLPAAGITLDSSGDLLTTTELGGAANDGMVLELFPLPGTTTAIASSSTSQTYGQSVTFTATVSPSVGSGETGTVQFMDGGNSLGAPITLGSGGAAAYTTSTLAVGSHSITAVYSGDANFVGSTSAAIDQSINAIAITPTMVSSQVGDGSEQRSSIYSISVAFNEAVNFTSTSFTLYQEATNADGSIALSGVPADVSSGVSAGSSDGMTWTFTVIGGGSLDRTTTPAAGKTDAGIFANGIYQLVLDGSAITDAATGSAQFNGGADKIVQFYSAEINSQSGGMSNYFHALYGDINGDGSVDLTDYRAFKVDYGTNVGDPNFSLALDFNGDGGIDLTDYRAFKGAYGQSFSY